MADVVTVLPPREGFSPGAVGAIGLVVHRLIRHAGGIVVGHPVADPFTDVVFRPASPGPGLTATRRYANGVLRLIAPLRPGLVEVHNRPAVAMLLARHLPRVVLVLHNDPLGMRGSSTARERKRLVKRLAGVLTVSDYLRKRFGPAPPGAVELLANAVDVPPSISAKRDKLILFMGRVVADKGADAFVAACAAVLPGLPGWRAVMIGADRLAPNSADTPYLAALRPQAIAAGITMLGYQPHDAAMRLLATASIAVVPSRWDEPFGLTALEAMAHGAALVCAPRGGLPEVVGEAALFADPDAPGALAAAIARLAQDPALAASYAVAGHRRALQFDTALAASRLLALRAAFLARPAMHPARHG